MSLQIIDYPQTTLLDGHNARLSFGYNPMVLKVGRLDFAITGAESYEAESIFVTQINIVPKPLVDNIPQLFVRANFGSVKMFEGLYNNLLTLDDGTNITGFVLGLEWDADYADVNSGFANKYLQTKIEVVVRGTVKSNEVHPLIPRVYSFDRTGIATIYLNAMAKDYFSRRLNVENMYCKGSALTFDLTFEYDDETVNLELSDGICAVKSVQQLGGDMRMGEYGIYTASSEIKIIKYGYLYNYFAISTSDAHGGFITGFSVPLDSHVVSMHNTFKSKPGISDENLGRHMKSTRYTPDPEPRWDAGSVGFDTLNFNAIPGGFIDTNGNLPGKNLVHTMWTRTPIGSNKRIFVLFYYNNVVTQAEAEESRGHEIRLQKSIYGEPEYLLPDGTIYDQVTDFDGNTYDVVKIGYYAWTVQPLATTKYVDGTDIFIAESADQFTLAGGGEFAALAAYGYDNNNAFIFGVAAAPKKILTAFEKLYMFEGYNMSLYALFDNIDGADEIKRKVVGSDGEATLEYPIETFADKGVYQFELPNLDDDFTFQLIATLAAVDYTITDEIDIYVKKNCEGVYLRWENDLGAYDYWLFEGDKHENVQARTLADYMPFMDEINNFRSNRHILEKDFDKTLRVFTYFDKENKEGFEQLLRSRQIDMLIDQSWYQVNVNPVLFNLREDNPKGKLSITIEMPKKYIK